MKNLFCKIILIAFIISTVAFFYLLHQYNELKESNGIASTPCPYVSEGCANPLTGNLRWIKLNEAVEMVSEYGLNQAANINAGINSKLRREEAAGTVGETFYDSRFIVFPMDTIKNFIFAIDKLLNDNKPLNTDGNPIRTCDLGLKFFYASYPGLDASQPITATYKGRHTLILVPTFLDAQTSMYTEFFPSAIDKITRHPYALNDLISWDSLGTLNQHGIEGLPLLAPALPDPNIGRNHGTLCPPPDNCFSAILQRAGN